MLGIFSGQTSADTLQLIKNDIMSLFNKKKEVEPKPYDILKAFQDEAQKIADDFSEKFPVGTFVKEWFGNDEWNCSFCYISSDPYVDLDETTITNYNIEQYKKCKNNKNESCIYVNYIPINIYCLDNTCGNPLSNRFTLCESRHVVKSSFEEYRDYMLNKFNENIVHHKEQIKRDREFIRDNKRRIRHIDSDLEKAIAILNASLEAEIKRNNKK